MKLQTLLLFLIFSICLGLIVMQVEEPKTVHETEYFTNTVTKIVTEKEYIKINQTEPIEMEATAYTSNYESTGKRPSDKGYGITATGTVAKRGVCAVDSQFIPYGTYLYVDGYGVCRAEDSGSKIKGYSVDVWMENVSDAMKFGREKRKVWILTDFEGWDT